MVNTKKLNNFVKENEFTIASNEEKDAILSFVRQNNRRHYGIIDDVFYVFINNVLYTKSLPFLYKGVEILTHNERVKLLNGDYFGDNIGVINSTMIPTYFGMHLFIPDDVSDKIKKSKNYNIKNKSLYFVKSALEYFFNIKTTYADKNAGILNNRKFNFIVNCISDNKCFINKPTGDYNQIIAININNNFQKDNHVIIRGFVPKNKQGEFIPNFSLIIDDNQLATAMVDGSFNPCVINNNVITPFYSLNDIIFNGKMDKNFTASSIVIDKNVDFAALSEEFIESFENSMFQGEVKIIYVQSSIVGCEKLRNLYFDLDDTKKLYSNQLNALKLFAQKYRLGIVFYDDVDTFHTINSDRIKYYYNFKEDNNVLGKIDKDGNLCPFQK